MKGFLRGWQTRAKERKLVVKPFEFSTEGQNLTLIRRAFLATLAAVFPVTLACVMTFAGLKFKHQGRRMSRPFIRPTEGVMIGKVPIDPADPQILEVLHVHAPLAGLSVVSGIHVHAPLAGLSVVSGIHVHAPLAGLSVVRDIHVHAPLHMSRKDRLAP